MAEVDPADLSATLSEGFQQVTAEKVFRLLGILREIQSLQSTTDMFTLKGGTALNVFHWRNVPRLSVDIDLMATGFPDASAGSPGHGHVVNLVEGVARGLGYRVKKDDSPTACTLFCAYRNTLGSNDQVKIDLDILNRQTLLPHMERAGPALFLADDLTFPVVDEAELVGQKLTAVAYRHAPRDLYDMYQMLLARWHQRPHARACYLAYSFLEDHAWYRLPYPAVLNVDYDPAQLNDVLRGKDSAPSLEVITDTSVNSLISIGPVPLGHGSMVATPP